MANLTRKQQTRLSKIDSKIAEADHYGWTYAAEDLRKERAALLAVAARKPFHNYRDQHDAHVKLWGAQIVTRVNLFSGKEYQERRDTPGYLSPSRESYWSM